MAYFLGRSYRKYNSPGNSPGAAAPISDTRRLSQSSMQVTFRLQQLIGLVDLL